MIIWAHELRRPDTRHKASGRKPLPDDLPREVIEQNLPEADKVCDCGQPKARIGAETSERLEFIPAKLYVEHHVRHLYACPCCE
ncbi:IS66 family transposase zinc-finger binding domain-containing protein [Saccharospirillum alexandrii]|uniref:IS66 family transposase zinc-finger binding domain-containing protein n=1 Tax=Saccharospirillum alexandrii TaxID=2448477 RepID=UPI000FDCA88B|nr:IS66 family transposase zinc-finger binding domain-containing protein [Saccharospirillum alexandrii]